MATLNINGKKVKVDDSFLSLSPEEQNATVDEIAASLGGAQPQQTATAPQAPDAVAQPSEPAMAKTSRLQPERGVLRRIDDAVRGFADVATFGLADEFAAKMGALTGIGGESGNYDKNLVEQRSRDASGGPERFAGQIAGAFAVPGGAAKTVGRAALGGAATGAAYGFGSGEGGAAARGENALLGGAIGGLAGGAVRGIANRLETKAARAAIPTNETLRAAGQAAYKAADNAGVIIKPESTQRLTQAITSDLAEFGYDPALQPGISAVLNRIQGLGEDNITLKGMDIIRRVARNAGSDITNKSQQELSNKIIGHIDDFIGGLKPDDVLAGNTKEATNAMLKARNIWTRLKKAEMVDTAMIKAERRAASTGSGGNADNALRQNVRALLDNPKTARGMTKAEKAAAERVVRGTAGQNALRLAGKLSPQGNGLMAALGVGGAMTNPLLGVPSLVGVGAKAIADRATVKNVDKLSEIIRSGGFTAAEVADLMRRGLIRAPEQLLAIERSAQAVQNPLARLAGVTVSEPR